LGQEPRASELVGRGARDGAALFRRWFAELGQAAEAGAPTAYVFVMGSLAEVLRAFDLHMVFPEITSLQMAVRGVAHEYLKEAEDYGYSPDICGYVKADVALQLRHGEHPMGRVPRPSLAVVTNACNTYIKWAEIWERMYQVPVFTLDVPGTRTAGGQTWPGDADFEADRRYVEHQIQELVALCETVTGRRLDIDRLREVMHHTNEMSRCWQEVIRLNGHVPAPFNALTDGTIYLGVINALRGTPEGAAYFRDLVDELRYKAEHGLGPLAEERFRLVYLGIPCYPIFRRFNELFTGSGGNFVNSTYLWFAAGGANRGFEYDLARPLESLAEGVLVTVRDAMDSMFFPVERLVAMAEPYHVDGLVFHASKSCRTTATGMADARRAFMAARDLPTLFIESDMMDRRVVSEAQLKNRVDAFFENLATRRRQDLAAG